MVYDALSAYSFYNYISNKIKCKYITFIIEKIKYKIEI